MALFPLAATDTVVTVYLNTNRDELGRPTGMAVGYRPGDQLRLSFRLPLDSQERTLPTEQVASKVFHLLNVGDDPAYGTPDPRALAYRMACLRSLSVGDVVELDDTYFAVARFGFDEIAKPTPDTISLPWS